MCVCTYMHVYVHIFICIWMYLCECVYTCASYSIFYLIVSVLWILTFEQRMVI